MGKRKDTLKKRAAFIRAAKKGRVFYTPFFIIQVFLRSPDFTGLRKGVTAARRVGNAVCRNYTKRRLRVLMQSFNTYLQHYDADVVMIAKRKILSSTFCALENEMKNLKTAIQSFLNEQT